MSSLFFLVPMTLLLATFTMGAFLWAMRDVKVIGIDEEQAKTLR